MSGLAVRANLLCITYTAARGRVFLFDLQARARLSNWALPGPAEGYSDAAGVAMDPQFRLLVADTCNGRVRCCSVFGRHLADFGRPPEPDGDAGRDRPGVLDRPHAVALLPDAFLVSCGERPLRRGVQRFSWAGDVLAPLLPQGDPEGRFGAPRGLWADRHGILVADTLHGRIERYRTDGRYVAGFGLGGGADEVRRPWAVARTGAGDVLVVDQGDRPGLRCFSPEGAAREVPGDLLAQTEQIAAFAQDEAGRLYVLDHGGERVLRFGPDLAFDRAVVDLTEHLDGT